MKFNKTKVAVSILIIILLILTTMGTYLYKLFNRTTNSSIINSVQRNEKWRTDLKFLKTELPNKHKNLFFFKPESEFNKEMDLLISKIEEYDDTEIKAELAKIINSINDSHTSVDIYGNLIYPLRFFQFEDGIYLSNCSQKYKDFWGKKLVSINGYSIEQLHSKLDYFVSKDNKAIEKTRFPALLRYPEILKIAGINKNDEAIFTFKGSKQKDVSIKPLKKTNYKKVKFLSYDSSYVNKFPLSKQNSDKNYWFNYFEKDNAIYVKYNSCSNMKNYSFSAFTKDVFKIIDSKKVKTLVIDLRDNCGGSSLIFHPFLREIKKRDNINKKDNLFVIVGRVTFSSAVLNTMDLKNKTNATLIGEPTSGKPNHYGEVKILHLSNVDLNVQYSSNYFKTSNIDTDSLYPDKVIPLKASSYFNGKDDFLDYIFK